MHPEEKSDKPGKCPKCGMNLKLQNSPDHKIEGELAKSKITSYKPLFIIISLIFAATISLAIKDYIGVAFSFKKTMAYFMAGFFLVFSGFKLLDLRGFAHAYATYDLLASRLPKYGLLFPFLEFSLGLLYLNRIASLPLNLFAAVLMSFSGLGVLNAIFKKRKFECACLGTIIKLPLTYVTLIEDFGMALMAIISLII